MPPPDLAARIAAPGAHEPGDFIEEGGVREALARLAAAPSGMEAFRGRSVLLAMKRKLEFVAALIALDGVARRIVLWPQDGTPQDLATCAREAGVDFVLTAWPSAPEVLGDAAPAMPARGTEWVLFTSGTTGRPKMVVHDLQSLASHIVPDGRGRVWCTFYDIRRYGGLQILLRALAGGGSLVLAGEAEAGQADMAALLDRAGKAGATHFLGTPSHWRLALMVGAEARIAPRYVRLSGEVADQMILDRLAACFPGAALVHAFASTEAGLGFEVTDGRAGFPAAFLDRAGGGPELRVRDGVLQIRSVRCAASTAGADGFVDTGDAVELVQGRYVFAGRRDGVVNVGGQKVFPEEVEAVLNQHPSVRMSRVSARRNAITGAVVSAEIVPVAAAMGLVAELGRFCADRLPRHKVPVSITIVPSLEIAPSGKLVRRHA